MTNDTRRDARRDPGGDQGLDAHRSAWDPWRTLRRLTHVRLERRRLDDADAMLVPGPEIVLDVRLDRRARTAALAHELVHLQRGGGVATTGMPRQWRAVVWREERTVDREVATRLVPAEALRAYLRRRSDLGEAVTVDEVADEFDVATWVARVALEQRAALVSRGW